MNMLKSTLNIIPNNSCSETFRSYYFPKVSEQEWRDWHWQLRHTIKSFSQLRELLPSWPIASGRYVLPLRITPYYLSLIDPTNQKDSLARMVFPSSEETQPCKYEHQDPIAEDQYSPIPGLVHRYPDRVLILLKNTCPLYCRYCTRNRRVGKFVSQRPFLERFSQIVTYISQHKSIHDILISGGEPLLTHPNRIHFLLASLRSIPHIDLIRFSSKLPVVLPYAITPTLLTVLRQFRPIYINIHLNHPREITSDFQHICLQLTEAGVILGSQTVLLRGINDSPEILKTLWLKGLRCGIRPYYLLQCDLSIGTHHFWVPISEALHLYNQLKSISGMALPKYVVDLPNGGGKIYLGTSSTIQTTQEGSYLSDPSGTFSYFYPNLKND